MWALNDYKTVFIAAELIGVLVCCIPSVMVFVRLPPGETFSELYVLGSEHMMEDYPSNVTSGVDYLVYVGVVNHLGNAAYYEVLVKFRNETDPLPNSTSMTPSALSPLYTYRVFLDDNGTSEVPLTFSFSSTSFSGGQSTVGSLTINGVQSLVDKSSSWDAVNSGYYYQLFVELWVYGPASDGFTYNNRFVSLWLKLA